MRVAVRKWGNSLAIRIPGPVASALGLQESAELDVVARHGTLSAVPVGRWTLEALVSGLRRGESSGVPERGDLVWIDLDQARRPALVVSPAAYNAHGSALVCPITSLSRGDPFEVAIPSGHLTDGVVLAHDIRSVDWRVGRAERTERIPGVVPEVLAKARTLLEP